MMLTDEASPFLVREDGRTLRIGWDNRRVRKDNAVFWIFVVIWSIFGWLGTLLIPYSVIGRTWSEWIEISPEAISCGSIGFLTPKPKTFSMETIFELGC